MREMKGTFMFLTRNEGQKRRGNLYCKGSKLLYNLYKFVQLCKIFKN